MEVTLDEITDRKEPIDFCGIKATRKDESTWIVWCEEYNDMEFDMSEIDLKDLLNMSQGKRYRKCIAWRMCAGNGYACFEMCDEHQRSKCSKQQEIDEMFEKSKVDKNKKEEYERSYKRIKEVSCK
jgi:hypothetical protein